MLLQELFDKTPSDKKHKNAAIAALKRRLSSKGDKESVASAAYEIGRAYGISARELARMYNDLNEAWSEKYKHSIDCNNPKGFSQRAHCAGRKKK